MKCPRCGLLNPDGAQRCDCGYDFENGNVKTSYLKQPKSEAVVVSRTESMRGTWLDENGFTRKQRQWFGLFCMFCYGALGTTIRPSNSIIANLIPVLVAAALFCKGILMLSSHDVRTWKAQQLSELYIYAGCIFMALPGILVYYFLKARERRFLQSRGGDAEPVQQELKRS